MRKKVLPKKSNTKKAERVVPISEVGPKDLRASPMTQYTHLPSLIQERNSFSHPRTKCLKNIFMTVSTHI